MNSTRRKKFVSFSVLSLAALALWGCSSTRTPPLDNAQYWQKVNTSEVVYARGPKAQQQLNRDIAHCVSEVRELVRLGALREEEITRTKTTLRNPDEYELRKWEDPERDRYMFTEHSNYQDFEGCMLASGWERVKYVPYDVAKESKDDYYKAHVDYGYQTRKPPPLHTSPESRDLNQ